MVMNEGVKVVAGAFRTAPRLALHELTRILPAAYYIEKLTQTSSLRLYRVPRTSQLLGRLGPYWDGTAQNSPHASDGGVVRSTNLPRSGSTKPSGRGIPDGPDLASQRLPRSNCQF